MVRKEPGVAGGVLDVGVGRHDEEDGPVLSESRGMERSAAAVETGELGHGRLRPARTAADFSSDRNASDEVALMLTVGSYRLSRILFEDRGRRPAGFDRHAHDRASARLDRVSADDRISGPVGALHEDVWLERANEIAAGVASSKIIDGIDARERGAAISARSASGHRSACVGPLFAANGSVGVHGDDQRVALGARRLRYGCGLGAAGRTRRW